MVNVVKKNGKEELFDCKKIKKAIAFACDGLDVNPIVLESKFDEFIFEGVKTTTIQDNLILHAKNLASPTSTDWVTVAGRLAMMNLWSKTKAYKLSFKSFVKKQIKNDVWKHPAFLKYSDDELELLGAEIIKERDLQHSITSVETFLTMYALDGESIQQAMMGNAMCYASVELPENRMKQAIKWYHEFSRREISLASPHWINLRSHNNLGSCFIIACNDDLDSIYRNIHNAAKISKVGGGIGFYWGYVRAKGDWLMGEANGSGGVLPFIKVANDTAIAVNQGGKRKGAITCALPDWHGDIEDFLEIQTETGDARTKSFDIQPQICIHDTFMERLLEDKTQTWYTFSPAEVLNVLNINLNEIGGNDFTGGYNKCVAAYKDGLLSVVKEYIINDLWKKILQVMFERGKPYIFWTDRAYAKNPNKHDGIQLCSNLCVESYSNTKPDVYAHTCSLVSLTVGRIAIKDLSNKASSAVRILDNAIDLTIAPIEESANHMRDYRTVGVGVQGFSDICAREWKAYTDLGFAKEVMERIQFGCVRESIQLAKERGAYPKFKGSRWDSGEQFDDYIRESVCPDLDWQYQKEQCKLYGIRNSQLTSPAPNTKTSLFMDAGAGFMPTYGGFFYEDNGSGKQPVVGMFLKENPLAYARTISTYYQPKLTEVVGAAQLWVDTGISAEYVFDRNNPSFNATHLDDLGKSSWKNGNKAIYYIRTIKQGETLVKEPSECIACAD